LMCYEQAGACVLGYPECVVEDPFTAGPAVDAAICARGQVGPSTALVLEPREPPPPPAHHLGHVKPLPRGVGVPHAAGGHPHGAVALEAAAKAELPHAVALAHAAIVLKVGQDIPDDKASLRIRGIAGLS
jgi:hypothetical protein